jgi:hypothetical protein
VALGFGRVERLEHPRGDVRAHPGAGVADQQPHVPPGDRHGVQIGLPVVEVGLARLDDQGAAAGHRVPRVDRQVHQDLLDLPGVGVDGQRVR